MVLIKSRGTSSTFLLAHNCDLSEPLVCGMRFWFLYKWVQGRAVAINSTLWIIVQYEGYNVQTVYFRLGVNKHHYRIQLPFNQRSFGPLYAMPTHARAYCVGFRVNISTMLGLGWGGSWAAAGLLRQLPSSASRFKCGILTDITRYGNALLTPSEDNIATARPRGMLTTY